MQQFLASDTKAVFSWSNLKYLRVRFPFFGFRKSKDAEMYHWVIEGGRTIWRPFCPSAGRLRQGHPEPAARNHVQMTFEYLQGWRLRDLHGQPVLVALIVKMFPCMRYILCFCLCPLTPLLSLGTIGRSLAPSSQHLPFRYLYLLVRAWAFSRESSPSFLSLFSCEVLHYLNHLNGPLLDSF